MILKPSFLVAFLAISSSCFADWPQWLGPSRDGFAPANETSVAQFSSDLKPVWRIGIGSGFSSPVISGNHLVYVDEDGTNEVVHLAEARTGKETWRKIVATQYADEWGAGPRSTPTIDGDRIFVQSCNGEFRCLDLADGKVVWQTSFEKDFGVPFLGSKAREGTASRRGNNGSPLVDEGSVIVPVGSTNGATLVCFDKRNGKILWKSGNDEAAYSSPQVATIGGVRQVVYLSADALLGFARADGKLLWRVPLKTAAKRHAATPVVNGDDVIVNSHTFGVIAFKVLQADGKWEAAEAWANKEMKINLATPVHVGDFLYSHGPKKNFVCLSAKTGELKWQQPGFGKDNSSVFVLNGRLLVLTDEGQLLLLTATAENYTELGRLQVCGKNWNFPAFSRGKLYVRDQRELLCYDLVDQ